MAPPLSVFSRTLSLVLLDSETSCYKVSLYYNFSREECLQLLRSLVALTYIFCNLVLFIIFKKIAFSIKNKRMVRGTREGEIMFFSSFTLKERNFALVSKTGPWFCCEIDLWIWTCLTSLASSAGSSQFIVPKSIRNKGDVSFVYVKPVAMDMWGITCLTWTHAGCILSGEFCRPI